MATLYRRITSSLHIIVSQGLNGAGKQYWAHEWNNIVFSDESRYCLWTHDGPRRVRRQRGERRNFQFAIERLTALLMELWYGGRCHTVVSLL
jgi:hypothetical protein